MVSFRTLRRATTRRSLFVGDELRVLSIKIKLELQYSLFIFFHSTDKIRQERSFLSATSDKSSFYSLGLKSKLTRLSFSVSLTILMMFVRVIGGVVYCATGAAVASAAGIHSRAAVCILKPRREELRHKLGWILILCQILNA